MTTQKFYTVPEVSNLLGIPGPDVSSRWMRGQFPHAEMRDKVLYIPESDLAPFMELSGPPKEKPPVIPINTNVPSVAPPMPEVAPAPEVTPDETDIGEKASVIIHAAETTAKEMLANGQAYYDNIKSVSDTLKQDAEHIRAEADEYYKATKEKLAEVEKLISERQAQYDLLNGEFTTRRNKLVANIKKWAEYALNDSMNADYLLQRKNAMFRMSESLKRLVGR